MSTAATATKTSWIRVPVSDGRTLQARVWRPEDAIASAAVPIILEAHPYGSRWAARAGWEKRYAPMVKAGFACVLLDIGGSSESDGLMLDEYTEQETSEVVEVIGWLAEQSWSNGNIGMCGASWSGFNALQVAARRPPALRAIIAACASDDRYADDVHYLGGCLLAWDALGWAGWHHGFAVAAPEPTVIGIDGWRDQWLERLRSVEPVANRWLAHQRRDAFWKFNSVCEDPAAVECPVLMLGGWQDAYRDSVLRMVTALPGQAWGVAGPWGHKWPATGSPGPAVDFHPHELRWWRHWLTGTNEGVTQDPALVAFIEGSRRPDEHLLQRSGRWVAFERWTAADVCRLRLAGTDSAQGGQVVASPWHQAQGHAAALSCGYGFASDNPLDQHSEDALSACLDWPLTDDVALLGNVTAELTLRVDAPVALVAVRLCDVTSDGSSTLITQGQLNLTHRESHEHPSPVPVNELIKVIVPMRAMGYRVPAGHTVRLAVTPSLWPFAWPSPTRVTVHLPADQCQLVLPLAEGADDALLPPFAQTPVDNATAESIEAEIVEADNAWRRSVSMEFGTGIVEMRQANPGETVHHEDGSWHRIEGDNSWTLGPDPLSGRQWALVTFKRGRDEWRATWQVESTLTCDASNLHAVVRVTAHDGEELIHDRTHKFSIDRDHI